MPPSRPKPPFRLPVVYFAFGHAFLLAGLLVAALEPQSIAGFFYHPRMFAVVHLVTLGWITTAILGSTYVVGPLALRTHIPAGRGDAIACGAILLGAAGVVSHFWIPSYGGVGWSGILMLPAFAYVGGKVLRALRASKAPLPVRAHIGLAYLNLLLAVLLGLLLAFNRDHPFLPREQLRTVFGHLHLALLGWPVMMVMGVGYRLLPMFLPAKPPEGPGLWVSAVLLEVGVLGLALGFVLDPPTAHLFAPLPALAIASFLLHVALMMRRRVPGPHAMPRPDVGMLHAITALCYLLLSTAVGLVLAFSPELNLKLVMAYGVFGLLGFLSQLVLGMEMRLLPMFAWLEAFVEGGMKDLPPSPHEMPVRPLQGIAFACWAAGVPALAYGLAFDSLAWLSGGAWALVAGTAGAGLSSARVLAHAFRRRATSSAP